MDTQLLVDSAGLTPCRVAGTPVPVHGPELVDAHEQFEQFLAGEAPIECTQLVRIA